MVAVSRRALGVPFAALGVLCLVQPFLLRSAGVEVTTPTLADPASLVGLAAPAFVAAGAILLVSGIAAILGRVLAPRWSLSVPLVCVAVGTAFGFGVSPDVPAATLVVTGSTPFVVGGALIGGALAPVALGSLKGDTVTLLAGVVVVLAAVATATAPAFAVIAGLLGGGVAVALSWALDGETWRP